MSFKLPPNPNQSMIFSLEVPSGARRLWMLGAFAGSTDLTRPELAQRSRVRVRPGAQRGACVESLL